MTQDPEHYLIIHSNPLALAEMETFLKGQGVTVTLSPSGMDGLSNFSQMSFHHVILEAEHKEMPVDALIRAFRVLVPGQKVWLCHSEATGTMENLTRKAGANGLLTLPLDETALPLIHQTTIHWEDEPTDDLDLTMTDMQEEAPLEAKTPEIKQLNAANINPQGSFRHPGHLHITGNLENLTLLEVTGDLTVDGNVTRCTIRCNGKLVIQGKIKDCDRGGVFCRDLLEVGDIDYSRVVVGSDLFLRGQCRNALVTVVGRLIGKTMKTTIVGGLTRVGERLDIGTLGDKNQTVTIVEMAPEMLYNSWKNLKRRSFICSVSEQAKERQETLFNKQLNNPAFYPNLACARIDHLFAGVELRIANFEDYVFKNFKNPVLISLGQKYAHRRGICIRAESENNT